MRKCILHKKVSDLGAFSCEVETVYDVARSTTGVLLVWRPTRVVEATKGQLQAMVGAAIELECKIEADPTNQHRNKEMKT